MAVIYCLDINSLKLQSVEVVTERSITHESSNGSDFVVTNKQKWLDTDFNALKSASSGWDTIYSKDRLKTEPHFHDGSEHRVILSGVGIFFVPIGTHLYVIECSVGDYIRLRPNLVHWFSSKKHLLAARFFEGNNKHKERMKDIPHEIYRLRDECVDGFKMTI